MGLMHASKIIMFSDLECDYINPIDLCNKLNQVCWTSVCLMWRGGLTHTSFEFVFPENLAHAFLATLFLISAQWTAFILNLPLVLWNADKWVVAVTLVEPLSNLLYRIRKKTHMYDATEIFRTLGGHKKETFFKLGFYLVCFFYYLYRSVFLQVQCSYQADSMQDDCCSHCRKWVIRDMAHLWSTCCDACTNYRPILYAKTLEH